MKNRNYIILIIILLFSVNMVYSQELISAKELLSNISDNFRSNVRDYQARVKWIQGENVQEGKLLFKNPQKMKIEFSEPAGQVICTNGYNLIIYIPYLNLTLKQKLLYRNMVENEEGIFEEAVDPILINPVGLDKFVNEYSVEYHETKKKIAYKDGTMVYKFKCIRWRSSRGGANVVYLTVQENGLIRKVEGITSNYRRIVLEIDNIATNVGLSDLIFNYEAPGHTSTIENFMSGDK